MRSAYLCSFCGNDQDQTSRLIAGPNSVYVCGECIEEFATTKRVAPIDQKRRACSFCGKQQNQVPFLVDGPKDVHICGECINLCQEIIASEKNLTHDNRPEIKEE